MITLLGRNIGHVYTLGCKGSPSSHKPCADIVNTIIYSARGNVQPAARTIICTAFVLWRDKGKP